LSKDKFNPLHGVILASIWFLGVLIDRIWLSLDQGLPGFDEAYYLNLAVKYGDLFTKFSWFDGGWWHQFWSLTPTDTPLLYLISQPLRGVGVTGVDSYLWVNVVASAVLLGSIYVLGRLWFTPPLGLAAAGLCQLLPGLYRDRLTYSPTYLTATTVTLAITLLSWWWWRTNFRDYNPFQESWPIKRAVKTNLKQKRWKRFLTFLWLRTQRQGKVLQGILIRDRRSWLWVTLTGIALGLALLSSPKALFVLVVPWLGLGVRLLYRKRIYGLLQWTWGLMLAALLVMPWYQENWFWLIAIKEKTPTTIKISPLNLKAWFFYPQLLPSLYSWLWFVIPLAGLIYWGIKSGFSLEKVHHKLRSLKMESRWLLLILMGGYGLCSLNGSKDASYITPLLPLMALAIAKLMNYWPWLSFKGWVVFLSLMIMVNNYFPMGLGVVSNWLSPQAQRYPVESEYWPYQKIMKHIAVTNPYQASVVGIDSSVEHINTQTFSFLASELNLPLSGKTINSDDPTFSQNWPMIDWFLSANKTSMDHHGDLNLVKSWDLPNDNRINLYHRENAVVQVETTDKVQGNLPRLQEIQLSDRVPPGVNLPVKYRWEGTVPSLSQGVLLLSWNITTNPDHPSPEPDSNLELVQANNNLLSKHISDEFYGWNHDHSVGMGQLIPSDNHQQYVSVIETTAMAIPATVPLGTYHLVAEYLNLSTGQKTPLAIPETTIEVDLSAPMPESGVLDFGTTLQQDAATLALNSRAFAELIDSMKTSITDNCPLNYCQAIASALSERVFKPAFTVDKTTQRNLAYGLTLTRTLQRDSTSAIKALREVIAHDPNNPYGYIYLGFTYLYQLKPNYAYHALDPAMKINPELPEIKVLKALSNLMRGHVFSALPNLFEILK
jgi:4-amino-4-deoxy-L-arabinose transferase-like glycosyltransferase